MYTATKEILLPTTMAGSLPRPGWFTENLAGRPFRLAMADRSFREQYLDAVSSFIRDQERAGLDIVTDGDARFDNDVGGRSWISYTMERFEGVSPYGTVPYRYPERAQHAPGSILHEVHNSRVLPIVTGKIGPGHLEFPMLWRMAQQLTRKPVKIGFSCPNPIGSLLPNVYYKDRKELIADLCETMNGEFHRLADAGASIFQVEEPWIHRIDVTDETAAEESVRAFNRSVRGLRDKLELWCHTSWGNPAQQRPSGPDKIYGPALGYMNELDVDVLTFECASTGGFELKAIGEKITKPKIGTGVIDHRSLQVERPEEVADLIRKALEYIPAERLCITTDSGFGREGMARRHAFFKMVALVLGTNMVRRDLGVAEADVPAADERFAAAELE